MYDRDDLDTHGVYFLQYRQSEQTVEEHIWIGQAFLADMSIDVNALDIDQLPEALLSR